MGIGRGIPVRHETWKKRKGRHLSRMPKKEGKRDNRARKEEI
jgi:hypothetical protein